MPRLSPGVALRKFLLVSGLLMPATLWGCGNSSDTDDIQTGNAGNGVVSGAGAGGQTSTAGTGGSSQPPSAGDGGGAAGATAPGAGTGGMAGDPPVSGTQLPCDVADVLSRNCASCHGDPVRAAPMTLVRHEDFHKPGAVTQDQMVTALVKQRIHDTGNPMPPSNVDPLSAEDLATLDAWLDGGAPAGTEGDSCAVMTPGEGGAGGTGGPDLGDWENVECYEFRLHGEPTSGDTTPYTVPTGEQYVAFHFDAPWTEPKVLVSWRTLYDNEEVLHHWLFYKDNSGNEPDGAIVPGIGAHSNVELMGGWALGGNETELPPGVASTLPEPGGKMFVEWHLYNSTGASVQDRSGIEVCTVPKSQVDPFKIAGQTWIGSEFLLLPANQETTVRSSCTPSFEGLPDGEPIRIFAFSPHMHTIGSHMQTWILRADGTVDEIFDKPFRFDNQLNYNVPEIEVWPGDTIINDCTFNNTTNAFVGFGPLSGQEMCYQFTFSYPLGALNNGVDSLTGSTNTCWDTPTVSCPGCQ